MKFGLLMNVIILYHYLQYKDIGISYPFYLILLFCLLSKGVNAQYINLSSWKVFFSTEQFSWPKCLEHLLPQKQTLAAKGNKQIFKLSASNVWRSWPRLILLTATEQTHFELEVQNHGCTMRTYWFSVILCILHGKFNIDLCFRHKESSQNWLNSSLLHLISLTELHLPQARFKIAVFWPTSEISCSVRKK